MAGLPLVIFANKQEQLHAIEIENIKAGLNLHSIRDRRWTMIGSSAVAGQGLEVSLTDILLSNRIDLFCVLFICICRKELTTFYEK